MFTKLLTAIAILLIFASVGIFFYIQNNPPTPVEKVTTDTANTIKLPLTEEQKGVEKLFISYRLLGTITDIKDLEKERLLTLDSDDGSFPPLNVSDAVRVVRLKDVDTTSNITPEILSSSYLNKGQEVQIVADYDPYNKIWLIRSVVIRSEASGS